MIKRLKDKAEIKYENIKCPDDLFLPKNHFPDNTINEENITFVNEIQTQEDVNFLLELFDIYIRDLPVLMSEITFSITNKDLEKLKFYSHKLKGSALTLGVESIANCCIDLDNAMISSQPGDEVNSVSMKLAKSVEKVVEELKLLKEKYNNYKI